MPGVKMKALRTFRGRPGEGNERHRVKAGTEFTVENDGRAQALVRAGMASVVQGAPKEKKGDKVEPKGNKAAEATPTSAAPAGGETGEAKPQSSSPAAPAQRKPRTGSNKKDKQEPASS